MKKISLTLTVLFFSTLTFSQNLKKQVFEGTLDKKIPVIVTLIFDKENISGNVVYKKKGIPISVFGTINLEGNLFFNEMLKDGKVVGIYSLKSQGDVLSGSWLNMSNTEKKDLSVTLKKVSETTVPMGKPANLTGTYHYYFGKDGIRGSGMLQAQQIGKNKVAIAFNCVGAAPGFNLADVEKTILDLKDSKAIYSSSAYGKCRFMIVFYDNFVGVDYIGNDTECGFGNNATVSGNFIKVSSSVPSFEE